MRISVLGVEVGIGGRHVDAGAVDVELPAVIDAADAAFLVAAEPEIGAAMRAVLVDDADPAAAVAEGQQFLAQTVIFLGVPSGSGNSSESSAGIQKRRSNSPIGCRHRFR